MFLKALFLSLTFSVSSYAQFNPVKLSAETLVRFEKVPEFAFIQEEANRLGIKVYLFGGTASAFAHYVRWDLEREAGDDKYQKERFDYDFTNIYRGNQDLDIVVDGTAEQAAQLQQVLKEKYPHFVGNKDAWEVRLLKAQTGDKLPLLDNYDFLNQHTDTNSTGMLAINPDEGDIVFRDLFSWDDSESQFLKDVASGKIKFLFSKKHKTTSRAKDGKNPAVFAAIRYLAKLAQYEVRGTKKDLTTIQKIVSGTNWREIKNNPYIKHKLEEFGKKVLLNAPDSEYAWNLLEETGLRGKLIEMDGGRINSSGSLSWWMSKEPLRSKKIGLGSQKTAKEIFKTNFDNDGRLIVAHETNSFIAYENITRSSKGTANVFISRQNTAGEAAVYGDGFYTKLGTQGARGTNLTIRFKLDPHAKEGTDFIYNGNYIVVKNKNALTLIQENLNIKMLDFLKLLNAGDIGREDRGLLEKFKRKFDRADTNSKEFQNALKYVKNSFFISKDFPEKLRYDFSKNPISNFSDLMDTLVVKRSNYFKDTIPLSIEEDSELWLKHPEWIKKLIKSKTMDSSLVEAIYWNPKHKGHPEMLMALIKNGNSDQEIISHALSEPEWNSHPELAQALIDNGQNESLLIEYMHWDPKNKSHFKLLMNLIKKEHFDREIISHVISVPEWNIYPQLIKAIIENDQSDPSLIEDIHWDPENKEHPKLLMTLIEKGDDGYNAQIIQDILSVPKWNTQIKIIKALIKEGTHEEDLLSNVSWDLKNKDHPNLILTLIKNGDVETQVIEEVIDSLGWEGTFKFVIDLIKITDIDEFIVTRAPWDYKNKEHLKILMALIKKGNVNEAVLEHLFPISKWSRKTEIIHALLKNEEADELFLSQIYWNPKNSEHLKILLNIIKTADIDEEISDFILSNPIWAVHPELLFAVIKNGVMNYSIDEYVLSHKHWSNHPELKKYLNGESVNIQNLKARMKKGSFLNWRKQLQSINSCASIL